MSTAAGRLPEDHYSFEAYLALEGRSELRHELVGGRVILMSAGTRAHDQAAFYLAQRLSDAYSKAGWAVFPHNRKIVIDDNAYYPDAFVHCGPAGHDQYEVDAVVVVEVLSPSSALRDRREKAAAYVRLPSCAPTSWSTPTSHASRSTSGRTTPGRGACSAQAWS